MTAAGEFARRECPHCRSSFEITTHSDVVTCPGCRLICLRLARIYTSADVAKFMRRPRRDLRGETPAAMIANGRKADVDRMLDILIPAPNE